MASNCGEGSPHVFILLVRAHACHGTGVEPSSGVVVLHQQEVRVSLGDTPRRYWELPHERQEMSSA